MYAIYPRLVGGRGGGGGGYYRIPKACIIYTIILESYYNAKPRHANFIYRALYVYKFKIKIKIKK